MKKLLLISLILLLVSTVTAQVPKPFTLYAGGGITKPTSMAYLDDFWKSGYNLSGGIGFNFLPMFQTVFKTEYHQIPLDEDKFGLLTPFKLPEFHVFMVGVEGRFGMANPALKFKPYVFGGGGLAITSYSAFDAGAFEGTDIVFLAFEDATEFYYNFGAGIELKSLPFLSVFAQIQMIQISTNPETTQMIPLTIGIKF